MQMTCRNRFVEYCLQFDALLFLYISLLVFYRSEWDEFWRTATNPTTPSIFNNDYNQNTPQFDPYNPYKHVFNYYKSSTIQTTKNPSEDLNNHWFYKFASKSDTFVSKKPAKNAFEDFNHLNYGKTTPQNDLYSYLKNDQAGKFHQRVQIISLISFFSS